MGDTRQWAADFDSDVDVIKRAIAATKGADELSKHVKGLIYCSEYHALTKHQRDMLITSIHHLEVVLKDICGLSNYPMKPTFFDVLYEEVRKESRDDITHFSK